MAEKYKDKRLAKLAKGNSKFIKLDVGDSFKGKYLTWRSEMDEKFKKLKPVFFFKTENGEEKQLGTSATKFIGKMQFVIPGSVVLITKLGEGQKTNYSVKVLKEAKMPKNVEDEDEDEEDEEEEEEDEAPKKKKKVSKPPFDDDDEEEAEEDEEEAEEDDEEDLFN